MRIELTFFAIFLFLLFFIDNDKDKSLHSALIDHYSCNVDIRPLSNYNMPEDY